MGKCNGCNGLKVEKAVEEIVNKHRKSNGALMSCLHEIQDTYGYISEQNQKYLSEQLNVPLSKIYGVITFYSRFTLLPKGKYNIQVCMGTACYVKGSESILNEFKAKLNLKEHEVTPDGLFSLEGVRCIGACGLAPAIVVNSEVYGKVTVEQVDNIIKKYKELT